MEYTKQIPTINKADLVKESLENSISYQDYRTLVANHVESDTSTGENQSEALSQYTLLNNSRMKRLDKTIKVPNEVIEKFQNFKGNVTWLVLTESWCGDAAQTMPAINKLSELSEGIDLKVILRDENIDLMNAFLTNGGMSIPKLIVFDNDTEQVIADWGPRPTIATQMVHDYKEEHGGLTPEFKQDLQVWYNKDKSQNTIDNVASLI